MAGSYIAGNSTLHYINWIPVTCALNAGDLTIDRNVTDARTFCGNEQIPGEHKPSASFGGFGYWGADEYEDELTALMQGGTNANRLVVFGTAAGSVMYEIDGPLSKESFAFKATDLIGLNGEIAGGDTLTRGLAVNIATSVTAAAAKTGKEVGATAATETFVGTIRVEAVNGAGTATFVINQSTDDGAGDAYAKITGLTSQVQGAASAAVADEITFTGKGIGRMYKLGATEAWKQIECTAFAGFTSVTVTFTAGTEMPD